MSTKTHVVGPQPGHPHTHTIIFLHGKGSDSEEFSSEFFESEARDADGTTRTIPDLFPSVRWVFPSAPLSESTRFECTESQWFDMWAVELPNDKPEMQMSGLEESIKLVLDVVEQEEALVPCEKIFLGGISQGFATVYSAFISGDKNYAGLIGLSSWAPSAAMDIIRANQNDVLNSIGDEKRSTNVFIGHCEDDKVIPVKEGRNLRDILKDRADTVVEYHEYADGGHWVNEPQGAEDIAVFLRKNMA